MVLSEASATEWFGLMTRYQCERRVSASLRADGLEVFLPVVATIRQWRDRRMSIDEPLFPGYVFVRTQAEPCFLSRMLRAPGAVAFVTRGGKPVSIPEEQIETVRRVLESKLACKVGPLTAVGDRVIIRGGCLDGICGIVTDLNRRDEVVIAVGEIQRSLTIQIGDYCIEKLSETEEACCLPSV